MGQVINFDDVVCEIITVIKRGRTFELRDDVPMEIIIATFGLADIETRLRAAAEDGQKRAAENGDVGEASHALQEAFGEIADESVPLCAQIIRHTYPQVTDDEVADLFTFEERMALIRLFFTRRLGSLNEQSNATNSARAALAVAGQKATAQAMGNRATRRSYRSPVATPKPTR